MNKTIEEIYERNGVLGPEGEVLPLKSAIDREEGDFLLSIFRDNPGICKTLEVGCAYGLSSLHICEGIAGREGAHHTILDPFQNAHWQGIGIKNLKDAGFEGSFELVEEKSEFALPSILKQGEEAFDLVFIDGFHTFDHTLLDCFYGNRLIKPGGFLVVDDTSFPAIRRVIDYLENYPCFEIYGRKLTQRRQNWKRRLAPFARIPLMPLGERGRKALFSPRLLNLVYSKNLASMTALKKLSTDERDWKWYCDLF